MNYFVPQPILLKGKHGTFRRGFTVAEILLMIEKGIIDEDEKFELIDGEIIKVSPKHAPHEWVKYQLNEALVAATIGSAWIVASETTLYLDDRTFVEPDFAIVPRGVKNTDLKPSDIALVIEIAHSTLRKDREIKAPLYARFGLAEYWMIDARQHYTTIYRNPVDGRWSQTDTIGPDQPLTFPLTPKLSVMFSAMK